MPRTSIEDNTYGVYNSLIADMGREAKEQPDELIFSLLGTGSLTLCYDGVYFFDPEHVSYDIAGAEVVVSYIQLPAGNDQAGPAWYLLDTSRPIRPFIYQNRIPAQFTALSKPEDENVFWRDEYVHGVRARNNVGFGLWQLAQMSTAPLTGEYYGELRPTMQANILTSAQRLAIPVSMMQQDDMAVLNEGVYQGPKELIQASQSAACEPAWKFDPVSG